MDINNYANRIKYKKLPADFNHQDGAKFKSSYEYTKTFSNYHFDKWHQENDGDWWHSLGRFEGDWSDDVVKIIEKSKDLGWDESTKSGLRPGFKGGQSPMKAQEEYDRIQHGLDKTDQTNLVLEDYLDQFPKIKTMVNHWCLEKINYRAHVQWPGQFFGVHIDKLWHRNPVDPARIVRIIISLADYEPGQLIMYGHSIVNQWRAGDVHIFDTLNVPHGTANISVYPRPNLTITGLRTPETDAVLAAANKDSRYPV